MSTRTIIFTGVLAGTTILAAVEAAAQSPVASYDVVHNHWRLGATMPTPTTSPAVGAIGENIYVVGGYSPTGGYTHVNQIYNTKTNQWTMGATMPDAPSPGVAGAVVNGILYVFEGFTVQAYDPATNTWSTFLSSLPDAVSGFSTAVANNVIYIMGGTKNYS